MVGVIARTCVGHHIVDFCHGIATFLCFALSSDEQITGFTRTTARCSSPVLGRIARTCVAHRIVNLCHGIATFLDFALPSNGDITGFTHTASGSAYPVVGIIARATVGFGIVDFFACIASLFQFALPADLQITVFTRTTANHPHPVVVIITCTRIGFGIVDFFGCIASFLCFALSSYLHITIFACTASHGAHPMIGVIACASVRFGIIDFFGCIATFLCFALSSDLQITVFTSTASHSAHPVVGIIACATVGFGIIDFFIWIATGDALARIFDLHISFVTRIRTFCLCRKCTNGAGVLDDGTGVCSAQIDKSTVLTLGFVCAFAVADDSTMRNVAVFNTIAVSPALIEGWIAIDFPVIVIGTIDARAQRPIDLFGTFAQNIAVANCLILGQETVFPLAIGRRRRFAYKPNIRAGIGKTRFGFRHTVATFDDRGFAVLAKDDVVFFAPYLSMTNGAAIIVIATLRMTIATKRHIISTGIAEIFDQFSVVTNHECVVPANILTIGNPFTITSRTSSVFANSLRTPSALAHGSVCLAKNDASLFITGCFAQLEHLRAKIALGRCRDVHTYAFPCIENFSHILAVHRGELA